MSDKDIDESNKGAWSNFYCPPIHVLHKDLKRESEEDRYRSECPTCNIGILMVRRNQKTFELEAVDNCIFCGQHYIYIDIEDMRRLEKH